MKHLKIDTTTCVGCSLCKQVCVRDNIEIIDNKAVETENNCFDCGHCSAVCPTNSIIVLKFEDQWNTIEKVDTENSVIEYDELLNFYKQRRSCRWFKDKKINHETFEKLLKGAYYSPNRQNIQDVEFAVIDDKMDEFIQLVYDIISVKDEEFFRIKHLGNYLKDPNKNPNRHPLLWEGKQLLLAFSKSKTDGIIAMTRIELMAYSLGLGGFFSLFIGMSDDINHDKLMEFFPEIDKNKHMCVAFVLGYPRIKYLRTKPHARINVTYK